MQIPKESVYRFELLYDSSLLSICDICDEYQDACFGLLCNNNVCTVNRLTEAAREIFKYFSCSTVFQHLTLKILQRKAYAPLIVPPPLPSSD